MPPHKAADRINERKVEQLPVINLTKEDYHFVYHRNPDHFFRGGRRPYRFIQTLPSLESFSNAVYTPVVQTPDQRLGCLYDEGLTRIDASCTFRRRDDRLWNTDPKQLPGFPSELPVYDRPVLYLGYVNTHFGHFLMEFLARTWPLTEDFREIDRFLVHVYDPADLERPYIKSALEALGISREKIVFFDHPVKIKEVLIPEPSFQIDSHVYSKFKDTFTKLSIGLGLEETKETDQPVFLSRSQEKRGVRQYVGQEKLESFLELHNIRIVHPGSLPLKEQVKIVNQYAHIMGFQGSQFGTIAAALKPKTVTYLTDDKIWGENFLITKCLNHATTFVDVCRMKDRLRTRYKHVIGRITGKWSYNLEGFEIYHEVDHERATEWFKKSGLV